MENKLSIVTNISRADLPRIKNILPHWLEVFKDKFDELLIVFDDIPPSGRIGNIQRKLYTSSEILEALDQLRGQDSRVKILRLNINEIADISSIWFKNGAPLKCENGSPIFHYIYAIHHSKNDFILKCDCDMVFYEKGFVDEAFLKLEQYDIVSPPRILFPKAIVSTQAFFIKKSIFYDKLLPIRLAKLNGIEILKRLLRGKLSFAKNKFNIAKGFEHSLIYGIKKGLIKHYQIDKKYGNHMHVALNTEANEPIIKEVIKDYINGTCPVEQHEHDSYSKTLWEKYFSKNQ